LIAALAALLMLSNAAPALAAIAIADSDPRAGATVQAVLAEITITFTEEVDPLFSTIEVMDERNQRVEQGLVRAAPGYRKKTLSIAVRPLTVGTYRVFWRVRSLDQGSRAKGKYQFTIGPRP